MNIRLHVNNLAATTTAGDLLDLFSAYGNVTDVNLATDSGSRKSRGFGFVTMVTPEGARAAIQALHGKAIGAATLSVSEAPREEPSGPRNESRNPRRRSSHLY